ncbi:MAG TPA: CidA/LrgA family protein [Polyangia bacterium]|nr:CidA/LrgA family protein [Polyangia bacterium]
MRGFIVILLFQLGGALVARAGVPVPGPVLGMAALLAWLMARRAVPRGLDDAADLLLRHLALFFVPAAVGAFVLLPRLAGQLVPIVVAIVASTFIGLLVAGFVFQWLARRWRSSGGDGDVGAHAVARDAATTERA